MDACTSLDEKFDGKNIHRQRIRPKDIARIFKGGFHW